MNDKKFIRTKIEKSLRKLLKITYLSGHALTRFKVLCNMVSSLILRGKSQVSDLALGNPDSKKYGSKLQQLKRWLKNEKVSYDSLYTPYIKPLLTCLSKIGSLVFSIDGSQVGSGCMCLMFSVIYKNKAIPVIWSVHRQKKGHLSEKVHQDLLKRLINLVPIGSKVTVVGDGEFDGCDFQKDILAQKWNHVLRTGKNVLITENNWDNFNPKNVKLLQGTSLFFEQIEFSQRKHLTNLFLKNTPTLWVGDVVSTQRMHIFVYEKSKTHI